MIVTNKGLAFQWVYPPERQTFRLSDHGLVTEYAWRDNWHCRDPVMCATEPLGIARSFVLTILPEMSHSPIRAFWAYRTWGRGVGTVRSE